MLCYDHREKKHRIGWHRRHHWVGNGQNPQLLPRAKQQHTQVCEGILEAVDLGSITEDRQ